MFDLLSSLIATKPPGTVRTQTMLKGGTLTKRAVEGKRKIYNGRFVFGTRRRGRPGLRVTSDR